MRSTLRFHLREGDYRRAMLTSVASHLGILVFFTTGLSLLPGMAPLELGLGPGGGQGDSVSVGLAADLGGGAGMIKSPITPRPESAPVVEKKAEPAVQEKPPDPNEFVQEKTKVKPKPPAPATRRPEKAPEKVEPKPGLIPREADPGKGPGGGSSGSGGGFGSGRGVLIGSGTGEGNVDSWYIRQVEQRVGQNWLQTSLGSLERRVEAVATFVVQPSGEISEVELVQKSGVSSVDLAVIRAIRASHPLPPLPVELRGRPVIFRAVFEYPLR